jgi:hypothetical protein
MKQEAALEAVLTAAAQRPTRNEGSGPPRVSLGI